MDYGNTVPQQHAIKVAFNPPCSGPDQQQMQLPRKDTKDAKIQFFHGILFRVLPDSEIVNDRYSIIINI